MFKGAITALVTPFTSQGQIDERAFRRFIDWQIDEGINGLVPCGTTGESPTLSHEEHKNIVEICVDQTRRRVPVLAGSGSNSTEESISLVQHAENVGADGVLVVTPYYNKPSQEGLLQHYLKIAQNTSLPIILYNIPGRSVVDILPQTLGKLVKMAPNIIGVKDATCLVSRVSEQRVVCGSNFIQLSGDDSTALGFNAHGGVGCISVTSNILPRLCADVQNACRDGDYKRALILFNKLTVLNKALFLEPNPAGIKYLLSKCGRMNPTLRLPMLEVSEPTKKQLDDAFNQAQSEIEN